MTRRISSVARLEKSWEESLRLPCLDRRASSGRRCPELWCFTAPLRTRRIIVGRVTQNLRESKAMVVVPCYVGVWSSTRVRWSPGSLPAETVSYKSLFREVSLKPNGTLRYADLSAVVSMVVTLWAPRPWCFRRSSTLMLSQCSTRTAPWPLPTERGRPRCPRCRTFLAGRQRMRLCCCEVAVSCSKAAVYRGPYA